MAQWKEPFDIPTLILFIIFTVPLAFILVALFFRPIGALNTIIMLIIALFIAIFFNYTFGPLFNPIIVSDTGITVPSSFGSFKSLAKKELVLWKDVKGWNIVAPSGAGTKSPGFGYVLRIMKKDGTMIKRSVVNGGKLVEFCNATKGIPKTDSSLISWAHAQQ